MPFTINGIGTNYIGKKNMDSHLGVCEWCHRSVKLMTYETRLWFTFVYIPIIPLGRKQIIDYCSNCRRHSVLSVSEWNRLSEEAVNVSAQQMSENPEDPEAAIEMHATLVSFKKTEDAERLAHYMKNQFPDHVGVHLHLGTWYEMVDNVGQSDACFERALALEPENRDVKRAVAIGCIGKEELARARELLAFAEAPGPDHDPKVLLMLARAYQKEGQHEEALSIFRVVLDVTPALGTDRELRKWVQQSERAAVTEETILPHKPIYQSRAFVAAAAVALLIIGLMAINFIVAAGRTLHVVNGLGASVTIAIDGAEAVSIDRNDRNELSVGEGDHEAVIAYPDDTRETVAFSIDSNLWDRYFSDEVFVLNVGGAAVVTWEENTYSTRNLAMMEIPYRLYIGESFVTLSDIDYEFKDFPDSITMSSKTSMAIKKRRVYVERGFPPDQILANLETEIPAEKLMRFAEAHLRATPDDKELLDAYFGLSARHGLLPRCRAFLQAGTDRPHWRTLLQEAAEAIAPEPPSAP